MADVTEFQPVYKQLRELLRGRIESGHLPVGSTLPPEVELAKTFGVSRSTIRRAILDLVDEGLLLRKPRVGTVVIRSQVEDKRSWFRGITEDLRQKGVTSTVEVLEAVIVRPVAAVLHELKLPEDGEVLKLTRLRRIAGVPLSYTKSYIPAWVGITPDTDISGPFYEVIESAGRVHITYGRDVLGAIAADKEAAGILDVNPGAPILRVRRTAFVDYDRPVEFVIAQLRSDLYEYHVTLPRRAD